VPPVSRRSDINTANGVIQSNVIENVIISGNACAVKGSVLTPDAACIPVGAPHCAPVVVGHSGTVFAGGRGVTRIGDANNCGHNNATGESTVICGG